MSDREGVIYLCTLARSHRSHRVKPTAVIPLDWLRITLVARAAPQHSTPTTDTGAQPSL